MAERIFKLSNSPKINIDPEKEYNLLRQEVLNRLNYEHTILNINWTIVAAFFGFGLSNRNYYLIELIPLFGLLFGLIRKHNTYYIAKIDFFLEKKYKTESFITWEKYDDLLGRRSLRYQKLLSLGLFCAYIFFPVVALIIGWVKIEGSKVQNTLLTVDIISILLTVFIFIFFDGFRIKNLLENEFQKINTSN